ncbi:MAG: UDP-N-acetylmuramoyl-tripeptide--D-alanyl-D-alanine ligase [Candidatus Omnitrophica bacterium]|nr:UDP-N-acetylmuramoyl-tripeptide--D-alanyl-D-alanine ligase [Candidatus Omnitrophota bacterium]MCF7893587.1 UDP-N-acetylmuramoyl-tripeptide--D-alanyl-D-alanine ligase [Candidatus Omnitrophota bacterium]
MNISSFKTIEKLIKPYQIYNLYHFRPVKRFCLDSRSIKPGDAFIALNGKYKDGHDFIKKAVKKGAVLVVSEKKIETKPKVPQFIVQDTINALEEIILFLRKKHKKVTVFAITGSLGKTTTKEMLSFLLSPYRNVLKNKATENNIFGVAKTIFSYNNQDSIIFELGTNKAGEIKSLAKAVKPNLGVVTCIKPAHLVGLKDIKKIKKEKISLFEQNPKAKAVLNDDDKMLSGLRLKNKTFWYGKGKNNNLYYRLAKRKEEKVYFKILDKYDLVIPLRFESFINNYLAAILAAHTLGISYRDLISRINNFGNFPSMRMEKKTIGSYIILNDAYNANPYSFKQSLLTLRRFRLPKVVIAADMLELGSKTAFYHRKLADQIYKTGCKYCITYGDNSKITKNQLKALGYQNVFHFSSQKKIALFLKKKLKNKRYLIFLKGSRKMKLEKIVKYL